MPAGGRFGPQGLGGPFTHIQQPHLGHHGNQHHGPVSAGLPPPSFNSHSGFPQGAHHGSMNSFGNAGSMGLASGFGGVGIGGGGGSGLASNAAVSGFAYGASLQQQQPGREGGRGRGAMGKGQGKGRIRDVWAGNLAQEMQNLRELVERYPFVSMDTEFPGVVIRPMGKFTNRADYHYQTMRANIDLLSVIQLGITLFNADGDTPQAHAENGPYQHSATPCPHTWQFNFKFNPEADMFNQESIDFLVSTGMDLQMHAEQGIDPNHFGSALITSGLVMTDDIRWISFHSGYDFGYLVKIMHCKALPEDEVEYRRLLQIYFPAIYDIKYMVRSAQRFQAVNGDTPLSNTAHSMLQSLGTKGGLENLAEELSIKRVGTAHTAGSDSLLTGKIFWDLKKIVFNNFIEDERYLNHVWGLNGSNSLASLMTIQNHDAQGEHSMNLNGVNMYGQNGGQPTTPRNQHAGLAGSSSQQQSSSASGMGSLTPGGGGGVFGRFGGFNSK